jgi:hypothetical protein
MTMKWRLRGVSSMFSRIVENNNEKGEIIKQNTSYNFLFYPFYDEKLYNEILMMIPTLKS